MRSSIIRLAVTLIVAAGVCYPTLAQQSKKKSSKSKKSTPAAAAPKPAEQAAVVQDVKPDLNVRPAPLAATAFEFPKYQEFTMPNGLHVYVIENHEQPMVTMSMVIRGGEAYDPVGKEGTAAIAGDMLGKGTKKRTALQIAEALDGVGAGISNSVSRFSMKRNSRSLSSNMSHPSPAVVHVRWRLLELSLAK
jgi:hypothetical protein